MAGFARNRNLEMVETLNQEAIDKYSIMPSKFRYNNLLMCYSKMDRPVDAEKVMNEMIEAGIEPDCVTMTTLIDGYKRINDLNKCWELFLETRTMEGLAADEMLLSYMVRLAGKTHESEKALRIFSELETDGFHEQAKYYNSIISALGATHRYAELAVQYWQKM